MKQLLFFVFVLLVSSQLLAQTRTVLIEYGTGTWCSYCPRGIYYGHQVQHSYPGQVLIVSLHSSDIMEGDSLYFASTGIGGLPSGDVDRIDLGTNPTDWPVKVAARINQTPEADINVTRMYDSVTRELEVIVTATMYNTVSGNYKLGGVIIEDCIYGSSGAYAQSNSYSGTGTMGVFGVSPNPVPASRMVYDHVARDLITPYSGANNSLPASLQSGQTYNDTFTYILPTSWNEEYVRVYGYMTNSSGQIVNAGASPYVLGTSNAKPIFHCDTAFMVSANSPFALDVLAHDPDNDTLLISASSPLSWLTVQAKGSNDAELIGTAPGPGLYTFQLQVSDGSHTRTQDFTIEVISTSNTWTQIGSAGFSFAAPKYELHSAIHKTSNKIYTIGVDDNSNAFVYVFNWGAWSQLGSTLNGINKLGFHIEVNQSTGEPWIAIANENSGVFSIKKYSGNSWVDVGNSIPNAGSDVEMAFTSTGVAYLTMKQGNGGDAMVFTFDGTNWVDIAFPLTTYLAWNRIAINSNDKPVVLAAEFSGYSGYSRVYQYNGTTWDSLGGYINPSEITSGSSSSLHRIACGPNGEIFTAIAHSGGTGIYEYSNGVWSVIDQNIDGGVRESFDLKVNSNGILFVVYQNNNSKLTCEMWDGSSWSPVGAPSFSNTIQDVEMVMHADQMPAVVFADLAYGGKLSALGYGFVVGIENNSNSISNSVYLFPNPSSSHINIEGIVKNSLVEIYNAQGMIVWSGIINESTKISTEELTSGIYILRSGNSTKKFLVKH